MESSHQLDKSLAKITTVVSYYFDNKKLLNYNFTKLNYIFASNSYSMLILKPQLSNKSSVHTKSEIFFLCHLYSTRKSTYSHIQLKYIKGHVFFTHCFICIQHIIHTRTHTHTHTHCDKANAFNSFFHSVFSADDHVSPDFPLRTNVTMALPSFTSNEVRAVLLEAKKSRACGPNGCPSLFLTVS